LIINTAFGKSARGVRWVEVANNECSETEWNGLQSDVRRATCEWSEGVQHGSTRLRRVRVQTMLPVWRN